MSQKASSERSKHTKQSSNQRKASAKIITRGNEHHNLPSYMKNIQYEMQILQLSSSPFIVRPASDGLRQPWRSAKTRSLRWRSGGTFVWTWRLAVRFVRWTINRDCLSPIQRSICKVFPTISSSMTTAQTLLDTRVLRGSSFTTRVLFCKRRT